MYKVITPPTTEPVREDIPNKRSGIYKIECMQNQKVYIGSAVNIRKRWNYHVEDLRKQKHSNEHLQNAWNKYGANAFKFSVIVYVDEDKLTQAEQLYIDEFMATDRNYGFNICPLAYSNLGLKMSDEQKMLISQRRIGVSTLSPNQIEELRQRMKGNKYLLGHKHTTETKAKLKLARAGRKPSLGMRHTDEAKRKMSESRMGKRLSGHQKEALRQAITGIKRSEETNLKKAQSQSIFDKADIEKIFELRNKGLFYRQIGDMMGCSAQTVSNIIKGTNLLYGRWCKNGIQSDYAANC